MKMIGLVLDMIIYFVVVVVGILFFIVGIGVMNVMYILVIEWIEEIVICCVFGVKGWDIEI